MTMNNNLWCQVQDALAAAGIYFRDITDARTEDATIDLMREQIRKLEALATPESLRMLKTMRDEISLRRRFRQIRMENFFAACREGN